jgi:hypothetical protein
VDKSALTLQLGYVVERYLMDGDTVLLNRQPSLQKVCVGVWVCVCARASACEVSVCTSHGGVVGARGIHVGVVP